MGKNFFEKKKNTEASCKGFSLLEILFGLAIIILVIGIVISGFASFRDVSTLNQAVTEIQEILRDARTRTLAFQGGTVWGVHFTNTTATLFPGGVYNAGSPQNIVFTLPNAVQITTINLATTTANVLFERLTGDVLATGTIQLSINRSGERSKTITIYSGGTFHIE